MKYNLKIKVLTPVHIGNGLEYYPSNVIIQEGHLIKVNMTKFYNLLNTNLKKEFEEYMMSDEPNKELRIFLKKYDIKEFPKEYKLKYYTKSEKINPQYQQNPNKKNRNITYQEAIKDSKNRFYIPGSSLKGAIRTALTYKRLKEDNYLESLYKENLYKNLEDIKAINGRELIISDSSSTNMAAMRLEINMSEDEEGPKNYCETIEPNQELEANLNLIERREQKMKIREKRITFDELKLSIYEFSNIILEWLSEKVKNYPDLPLLVQKLKNLNTRQEPLLCIGRYKGFIATCVGHIYKTDLETYKKILSEIPHPKKKKHNPNTFPVSLNIFSWEENNQDKRLLPGWVKLSFEEIKN